MSLTKKNRVFLFSLAIFIEPHVITGHVLSVPEAYAESVTSLWIFGVAYGVYLIHRRDVTRREAQVRALEQKRESPRRSSWMHLRTSAW